MVAGIELVRAFDTLIATYHPHYGFANRCRPDQWPHQCDCSGTTTYLLNRVGIAHGCDGSFAQAREIHAHGSRLTIEQAAHTPGAFLFRGINEGQGGIPGVDHGHVGISRGDGLHSLEGRSHASGVGQFNLWSLDWDYAGMWPGVTASLQQPPPPVPPSGDDMKPVTATTAILTKSEQGRLVLFANGDVKCYGDAHDHGSVPRAGGHIGLPQAWACSVMFTLDEQGYWIATTDGAVFAFGNAVYRKGFGMDVGGNLTLSALVRQSTSYKAIRSDGQIMSPR